RSRNRQSGIVSPLSATFLFETPGEQQAMSRQDHRLYTVPQILALIEALPRIEQVRLRRHLLREDLELMKKTVKRELAKASQTIRKELQAKFVIMVEQTRDEMAERDANFCAAFLDYKLTRRNGRSTPERIRENAEICKLRAENPEQWTLRRLQRHFK